MSICNCKFGYCTGYLPEGLKVIRCCKTTNITNEKCGECEHYEKRVETVPNVDPCCDGENKTIPENPGTLPLTASTAKRNKK